MAYVERNPVRAGLVSEAWSYEWSSAAMHCGIKNADPLIEPYQAWEEEYGFQRWREVLPASVNEEVAAQRIRLLDSLWLAARLKGFRAGSRATLPTPTTSADLRPTESGDRKRSGGTRRPTDVGHRDLSVPGLRLGPIGWQSTRFIS